MTIFQLIKAQRGKDCEIYLWGRDGDGNKVCFPISDFRPFFFVEADESIDSNEITSSEWGYKSLFGEDLRKVFVTNPGVVPSLRERFSRTWEADIIFVRRCLISKKIRAYFKVTKEGEIIGDDDPRYASLE